MRTPKRELVHEGWEAARRVGQPVDPREVIVVDTPRVCAWRAGRLFMVHDRGQPGVRSNGNIHVLQHATDNCFMVGNRTSDTIYVTDRVDPQVWRLKPAWWQRLLNRMRNLL